MKRVVSNGSPSRKKLPSKSLALLGLNEIEGKIVENNKKIKKNN